MPVRDSSVFLHVFSIFMGLVPDFRPKKYLPCLKNILTSTAHLPQITASLWFTRLIRITMVNPS